MSDNDTSAQAIEAEVHRVIGECAGAASMCWDPRPEGVFDSTQAAMYVDGTTARVLSVVRAEIARACAEERGDCDEVWRQMFAKNEADVRKRIAQELEAVRQSHQNCPNPECAQAYRDAARIARGV